jgi:hypothetical protein
MNVNLLQAALDSMLFFLATNLVLFLFSFQLLSTFSNIEILGALSILFFIGDLVYRTKKYRLEIYEEKNPELKEVLRTARDNLGNRNIVSQALFDDVLDRARTITSESIIPSRRIIQKILGIGFLSLLIVLSGIADFQLHKKGVELIPNGEEIRKIIEGEQDDEFQLRNSSQIFGEPEDIDSSNLDIEFNITGSGESDSGSAEGEGVSQEELLLDISGRSLNENLDLAKKYSLAIKELES